MLRPLHLWHTLHGGFFSILRLASEGFLEVVLTRGKRHRF